jgi:hypothetical protein
MLAELSDADIRPPQLRLQAGYAVGDIVLAQTGWRTHAASAGSALRKLDPAAAPITTGLGVLGMPGRRSNRMDVMCFAIIGIGSNTIR